MTDYSKGKIYKIICNITGDIYIGSTVNTLERRLEQHKCHNHSSKLIIERGDYKILLIEEYPCETKQELLWRERYWIENNNCINNKKPIITKEEKIEKWRKLAKEQYLRRPIEYKEEKKIYDKEYREKNKEIKLKRNKEYYEKNKEEIMCECGCMVTKFNKSRHIKSLKHKELMLDIL